ncbi:MAG: DUF2185 domain-containing protein [Saprospiraceae bacterium]
MENQDKDNKKLRNLCAVSKMVTEGRQPIQYMVREASLGKYEDGVYDSGWMMMTGEESLDYVDNPDNIDYIPLSAVIAIDPRILPYLDAPQGSEWEWDENKKDFVRVTG